MRAATITGYDGIDDIELRDHPDPIPDEGEAVVRVEAASLNHRDLWPLKRDGGGEPDRLPYVPGGDLAGEVIELGDTDADLERGDRVVLCPLITCGDCRFCRNGPENMCERYRSYDGGFAEQALVEAERLVPLPEGVSVEDAAALPIAYMTAYRMLKRGDCGAGDLVFVPGATGGVGLAAVQLANLMGAETVGTSSSAEKLDRVERAGLDHAIHAEDPDAMGEAVADVGTVDVTINHVGGPFTEVGIEVLRRDGAMVICGSTAGHDPSFDARHLYLNHKRIVGSTLGTQPDLEELVDFVAEDRLDPVIGERFSLADTPEAFRTMADRAAVGKILVRPQE